MPPQIVTVAEVTESQFTQLFDQFEGNLEDVIQAAEEYVIAYLRWNPLSSTRIEIVPITGNTIFFKDYPVTELTSFEVSYGFNGPWTTVATDTYYTNLETGYIKPYSFGTSRYARITYERGYASVPSAIKQAIIMKTALLVSPDYEIFGSGDSKEPGLGHYEKTLMDLLAPFRRRAIGS